MAGDNWPPDNWREVVGEYLEHLPSQRDHVAATSTGTVAEIINAHLDDQERVLRAWLKLGAPWEKEGRNR